MPHNGCPHQCVFCNQKNITGHSYQPTKDDVVSAIETAINSGVDKKNTEIAFFGGSFTAIDRDYMVSLLNATKPYINDFYGIRLSTRPDAIDDKVLTLLKSYGVTSIELGAQSMCDDVLSLNERGHNATDVVNASNLIKKYNISLGLQMMIGLYGSTPERDIETAEKLISLSPDTVRIYPTITMKDTLLEKYYNDKKYVSYSKETTINTCAKILKMFYDKEINVIRVGLHYSDELVNTSVAGFYHPAFRELCESKMFLDMLINEIKKYPQGEFSVIVGNKFISKAIGQKKANIKVLKELGYIVTFKQSNTLKDFQFIIIERGDLCY